MMTSGGVKVFGSTAFAAGLLALAAVPTLAGPADEAVALPEMSVLQEAPLDDQPLDDQQCIEELRRCCPCPGWSEYVVFDALFLQRTNQSGDRPIVQTPPGVPVLTTQDLQPSVGTGFRTFYGQLVSDRVGWEVGYTGVFGMFGSAGATGPDNLQTPPPLAYVVNNFGDAHTARATYLSSLSMAELNLFRYGGVECRGSGATSCTGAACECCSPRSCRYLNVLAGFVWAGLNEQAGLAMTCCDNPPETATYNVRSSTNYFGAQLGMQGRREWQRWAIEGWWKTALCGTGSYQAQDPIIGSLSGEARGARSSRDAGVGFLGNLNATLVYRITDVWGLRAGYNVMWLTNAALAPTQWDFTDTRTSGTGINDNGTVFLHGANLGLEARW